MHTRRYKNKHKKSIKRNKKTRKIKSKKGGGWVGDLYLLKAIKRNFFPSQKDKERNLFFYKDSTSA